MEDADLKRLNPARLRLYDIPEKVKRGASDRTGGCWGPGRGSEGGMASWSTGGLKGSATPPQGETHVVRHLSKPQHGRHSEGSLTADSGR